MTSFHTLIYPDEPKTLRTSKLLWNRKSNLENIEESISFDSYPTMESIYTYLEILKKRFPTRVCVETVGHSYENRPLKAILIENGDGRTNKYIILIEAGVHAREWIAPSTALYIVHQLVERYEENKDLLVNFNWVVLPLANPDGYRWSRNHTRSWRKTRSEPYHTRICPGADINRNFDIKWDGPESSSDHCSDIYRGKFPFSESETCVIRDLMLTLGRKTKLFLSLHSYGPMILYPWGYKKGAPSGVKNVAKAGFQAILKAKNVEYKYGTIGEIAYPVTGASVDYATAVAHIPFSIVFELPGKGYGFYPPSYKIKDCVQEAWIGVRAMAVYVIERYSNFYVNYRKKQKKLKRNCKRSL